MLLQLLRVPESCAATLDDNCLGRACILPKTSGLYKLVSAHFFGYMTSMTVSVVTLANDSHT